MDGKVTLEQLGLNNNDLAAIGKLAETGLTPEEIADNVKYGVTGFINTDNPAIGLQYAAAKKELTKAIPPFTGSIAIKLIGIYNLDIDGTMEITFKEGGSHPVRKLLISGHWNGSGPTKAWSNGNLREETEESIPTNVHFAKSATDVYVLIHNINRSNLNTRLVIDKVLTNYNVNINLGFEIVTLTSLTGITIDISKADSLVGVETAEKINSVVNTYKEIIILTQAEYDAIVTKDPTKIYMIKEA